MHMSSCYIAIAVIIVVEFAIVVVWFPSFADPISSTLGITAWFPNLRFGITAWFPSFADPTPITLRDFDVVSQFAFRDYGVVP